MLRSTHHFRFRQWLPPIQYEDSTTVHESQIPIEIKSLIENGDPRSDELDCLCAIPRNSIGTILFFNDFAVHVDGEFYIKYDPFTLSDAEEFFTTARLFERMKAEWSGDRCGFEISFRYPHPWIGNHLTFKNRCVDFYRVAFLPICDDLKAHVFSFLG